MKKIFFLTLFACIAIVGCVSAAVPADNQTAAATATTAPQLIGGNMGTYLVKANVDNANVTFDKDFKGITKDGQLKVEVYTTGTPYRIITVEKSGYAVYTANITSVPAKNETVEIAVTLVPLAAANTTAQQANVTAPVSANTQSNVSAEVTIAVETATSPAPTRSGNLPFAAFAAFGVIGILAIRSRR
ncbi:hypothetical protein [Methanoregula sp.]|uniref:hypothetical protein n=1 Tax=Methanoregula sp. TaxID=2052170 RepID=UPI003568C0EF